MRKSTLSMVVSLALLLSSSAAATASSCGSYGRPIPLGVCGSSVRKHCGCNTGTLGSTVKDSSGKQYSLSNNHVLALWNTGVTGDQITQPDCVTGSSTTTVAKLTKFITLSTRGDNTVDAAIAQVVSGQVNTTDNILDIGSVSSTIGCASQLPVQKQGAGSGRTNGSIVFCTDMLAPTDPCTGNTYNFINVISALMNVIPQHGDSGALLVTQGTPQAVGLIFATGGSELFANPITTVLSDFGVTMAGPSGAVAPTTLPPPSDEEIAMEGVISSYGHDLMKIPGVWGVGGRMGSDGRWLIKVSVEAVTPEISAIPSTLGGFPVVITVGPRATFLVDPQSCPNRRSSK